MHEPREELRKLFEERARCEKQHVRCCGDSPEMVDHPVHMGRPMRWSPPPCPSRTGVGKQWAVDASRPNGLT